MWIKTQSHLYNLEAFERIVVVQAGIKWRVQGERTGRDRGTDTVTLAVFENQLKAEMALEELFERMVDHSNGAYWLD